MRKTLLRRGARGLFGAALLLSVTTAARATDNTTGIYWPSRPVTYRLNSALPADWKDAIENGAAKNWTDKTALDLTKGDDTTSTAPGGGSSHIWWRGAIPVSWRRGCPVLDTLACTRTRPLRVGANITDSDTVFNQDFSLGASSTNCALGIGYDVQTVALHEFGHWGYLGHSIDFTAAMFQTYQKCQRTPTQHDIDSMNANYPQPL